MGEIMKDISEDKALFERELEGYYQMLKDGIDQLPDDEFFDVAARYYSQLNDEQKKKYAEVHKKWQDDRAYVAVSSF